MSCKMKIELNKELIKRQVTILREYLNKEINQSNGYECMAKLYGFKNWNTFKAFLDNETRND